MNEKNYLDSCIKFMVFDKVDSLENFVVDQICEALKKKKNLNLAIEFRTEFSNIFNKLIYKNSTKEITFKDSNFFSVDEYIFDEYHWKMYEKNYSFAIMQDFFFKHTDYLENNLHRIIDENNFYSLFSDDVAEYDSIIDAKSGIDLLIIKMHANGSLIFNQKIEDQNLSTRAVHFDNAMICDVASEFHANDNIPNIGVTLGIDQIYKAKKIIVIATGLDKTNMVNKLFFTKYYDVLIPLCLLKNHSNVLVLSDNLASQDIFEYLDNKNYYENQKINNAIDVHENNYDVFDCDFVDNNFNNNDNNQEYNDDLYENLSEFDDEL